MPLYEYTCSSCGKRFSVLVGMTATADSDACPHCGHTQSVRRVSRFARGRTDNDRADALGDLDLDDPGDRGTMRRFAETLKDEVGADLGDDFDEYIDSASAGDDPADE